MSVEWTGLAVSLVRAHRLEVCHRPVARGEPGGELIGLLARPPAWHKSQPRC